MVDEPYVVKRTTMPQYGECDYWDERYTREPAAFDWYQGFSGLHPILQHVFPMHSSLLQVGVGSSRLQEEMARAGWRRIVNVDYSKVVISHMAALHKGIPALEYRVADVRDMPEFGNASFDGVLDKGTLDAILCGERSTVNATAMIAECFRVLKPGAAFMLVTYGDPASRLPYLEEISGWSVVVYALTKQELVEALDSEPVVRPLIKGPYPATNADCMDALSGLEGMHFVYICRRYADGQARQSESQDVQPPQPLPLPSPVSRPQLDQSLRDPQGDGLPEPKPLSDAALERRVSEPQPAPAAAAWAEQHERQPEGPSTSSELRRSPARADSDSAVGAQLADGLVSGDGADAGASTDPEAPSGSTTLIVG